MAEIAGRARGGGSTWQSVTRGTGSVESDYLNGEIVMRAREHGVRGTGQPPAAGPGTRDRARWSPARLVDPRGRARAAEAAVIRGLRLAAAVTAAAAALVSAPACFAQGSAAPLRLTVQIGKPTPVRPIASGFVGLSMEFQSAATVTGPPDDQNSVFAQLIRNLDPGQAPVLRIGGDSTDHTLVPGAGVDELAGPVIRAHPQLARERRCVRRRARARS